MSKKRRKHIKYRSRVRKARPARQQTAIHTPVEPQRPLTRAIERSPPPKAKASAERHQYARAEIKRSLVIGGVMFSLLIVLYLLFG